MSRRRLATTLAVVLGAGAMIGGPPASALSLSLRSYDLEAGNGTMRTVDAHLTSIVYTVDPVCLTDRRAGSVVEITGVSTDEARNGAEITDFGVYALTHPMGLLQTVTADGPLADADRYRDRTTRVDRPCSLNGRDQPSSTYLAVELSRPSTAPGVVAVVDRATIHFTVDGHRRTRALPLALAMCSAPAGIDPSSPEADGYCEIPA